MKKGFTLIELLGVIVILAILMMLVFPNIVNYVKNSSKKTDDLTIEMIYKSSDIYISNHSNDFPKNNGNKYVISLDKLVSEDLLSSPIKISDVDITNSKCVQVTYENGYKYELKDNAECIQYISTLD